jgi:DNA polymerase III alpha subunit
MEPFVELKDRILWFDGDSSMSPERIADMLLCGYSIEGIYPTEIDNSVKKFNLYSDNNLKLKTDIRELDTSFTIPQEYLDINLKDYILDKLQTVIMRDKIFEESDIIERIKRVKTELELFNQYNIENLIKTAIYIVDKFEENDIVWGTGRGSSCACYSLYLIGLHEVDSVEYHLELSEFFR